MSKKVYFTKEITPESLVRIYQKLEEERGTRLSNKVGVKISTGEPGGHNYLRPELIGELVKYVEGTIVENCTAYGGKRQDPKDHWRAISDHGFTKIADCEILDEFSEFDLPIKDGFHLNHNTVGEGLKKYKSILMLSHFKGHAMGGFGGALKNMSIGLASTKGKLNIHSAGTSTDQEYTWSHLPEQDDFLESMADACKSIIEFMGEENLVYVNVANNLSVDCDCDANPATPEMGDLGIFASLDPVALDQACYDAVKNSDDAGKAALIERMDSRNAIHTVEAAEKLGLGSREYEIVKI